MELRKRVARLEALQRSNDQALVIAFLPCARDPDYLDDQARIEALKAAGRAILIVDDQLGRHELWAGERLIDRATWPQETA